MLTVNTAKAIAIGKNWLIAYAYSFAVKVDYSVYIMAADITHYWWSGFFRIRGTSARFEIALSCRLNRTDISCIFGCRITYLNNIGTVEIYGFGHSF